MFLVNLQPLPPDAKRQPCFCLSSKTSNGSDIQATFDQIVTKVQMHIPVPTLSSDGDPSYNFRHGDFFIWLVEIYQENERNLDELLNAMHDTQLTIPICDPLHLAKNFRSRPLKYVMMMPTANSVRPVNLNLMKSVLGMTPAITDVSALGKMRNAYPLSIFCVQNITMLLHNGMIVRAIALLPVTLFLTDLRLEKVVLGARIDMP
jgi:hypothetical protein